MHSALQLKIAESIGYYSGWQLNVCTVTQKALNKSECESYLFRAKLLVCLPNSIPVSKKKN